MAEPASKISSVEVVDGEKKIIKKIRPIDQFKGRESLELVIAFSGPIGSGISNVIGSVESELKDSGYEVKRIKLSQFIEKAIAQKLVEIPASSASSAKAKRYEDLQTGGNVLRHDYQEDVLSELSIKEIAVYRTGKIPPGTEIKDFVPSRVAYLIDQMKHPAEVNLLRAVYGNLFFLFGVLATHTRRKTLLIDEDQISGEDAERLMERDRKEADPQGQQLEKTLQLADFFIRNNHPNKEALQKQIARLLRLMHGENGISPTTHEFGMYSAYAAGLRSACLSRQVGASLLDGDGSLLSTGRNDVPKFGGGLYSEESGQEDARCVKMQGGKCFNDYHKFQLRNQIAEVLADDEKLKGSLEANDRLKIVSAIAEKIYASSRIKDLIEFSRSIHAEMDAIVTAARNGGKSIVGSVLYTTTFPCHSCARHIIAAGIRKVYYIEPYEKSLAVQLHGDAMELEPTELSGRQNKVEFIHFEGVSPRQYINMFLPKSDRKNAKGFATTNPIRTSNKVTPEYLDDYRDFESKVIEHLNGTIGNM